MDAIEFVDGASLPGRPRFSLGGRSILIGPYDSPASHDQHFAETFGSGDPILDSTDELRFAKNSGQLLSCRLRVPENPTSQDNFIALVSRLPAQHALPFLPRAKDFQFPSPTRTEIDDEGRAIAIYRGGSEDVTRRVRIASGLDMLFGPGRVQGFVLHDPSDCLVSGWGSAPPPISDPSLARVLARFLNMLTPTFVDCLDDGDPGACERLTALRLEADHLLDSPQRQTFIGSIARVQETFCP